MLEAARRGVKVRLLLDDNDTRAWTTRWPSFNRHPNIEVRLLNPFSFRTLRALGYLTDFARLNRRMHNKSFTVDGVTTVVGGAISATNISAPAMNRCLPISTSWR